jgi:anaerobic selenocysteine-containing dehydrogenase
LLDFPSTWMHPRYFWIHILLVGMDKIVYTSCTLDCPDGCGIKAHVRDGRVVKLEGHKSTNSREVISAAKLTTIPSAYIVPSVSFIRLCERV